MTLLVALVGMLIEAFKHVEGNCGFEEAQKLFLFGQEVNQRTIALAKMNMYIHDITRRPLRVWRHLPVSQVQRRRRHKTV